jgi:hypothetical protein
MACYPLEVKLTGGCGPQEGVNFGSGWNELNAIETAFTPTAYLVYIEEFDEGRNPNFGMVYLQPVYGNAGMSPVTFSATSFGLPWIDPVSVPVNMKLLPKNEAPDNACEFAGNAPDPSFWASAGKASRWNPLSAILDLTKGFKIGGYLDAQPMASGDPYQRAAYGNYVFGVWMRASGTPLPIALSGAAGVAAVHRASNPGQYAGRAMDPIFRSLPAANVANIRRGYNDQKNGTLCHKY